MRTFILATALLVGSLAVPVGHRAVPAIGLTATALAMQDPSNAPPPPPETQPPAPPSTAPAQAAPERQASPTPQVTVQVQNPSWHITPMWAAIGALGVVLLVVVIVMATRDSSNTVIRG
jgi:hypothetical protein